MRASLTMLVAVLALAVPAAQQSSSVTLRSGEQFSGQLVDLGGSGFTFNVNGSERQVPKDQVVLIELETGVDRPTDVSELGPGESLLLLRSGETVVGEFVDIGGMSPLRLMFRTASGEREITSDTVRAIWVSKPAGDVASGGAMPRPGPQADGSIVVPGTQAWTDTGITVQQGQRLTFDVSGEIRVAPGEGGMSSPDGTTNVARAQVVPQMPTGGLIGRVGNGAPFSIGSAPAPITMPAGGRLMLGVNDNVFGDNGGYFTVRVNGGAQRPR